MFFIHIVMGIVQKYPQVQNAQYTHVPHMTTYTSTLLAFFCYARDGLDCTKQVAFLGRIVDVGF